MVNLGQPAVYLLDRGRKKCKGDTSKLATLVAKKPRVFFAEVGLSGPECEAGGQYYNALQTFKKGVNSEGVVWLEERVLEYCDRPAAPVPSSSVPTTGTMTTTLAASGNNSSSSALVPRAGVTSPAIDGIGGLASGMSTLSLEATAALGNTGLVPAGNNAFDLRHLAQHGTGGGHALGRAYNASGEF